VLAPEQIAVLRKSVEMGPQAPALHERLRNLQHVRGQAPECDEWIDQELLKHIDRINAGLQEAREQLQSLHDRQQRLTQPPWPVAVYRQLIADTRQAVVWHHGALRMVTVADEVDASRFRRGEDVLLNGELNLLIDRAPWGVSPVGETAEFVRRLDSERMIVRWRDEEIVVESGDSLADAGLREGDLVRWNRDTLMALEHIPRDVTRRHFVEQLKEVSETAVGGQRHALETIKSALLTSLVAPEKAARYGLNQRQSLLLVGPPGCGKTLMARVAASAIEQISGKKCYFAVVKPSEWENPYVGVTAANIRNSFEAFRKVAAEGKVVVVFLDELEAVGRMRGHYMGYHGDKHTAALLAELDGFAERGSVAVIAATNRKDLIDPALLERISDVEVHVPRPDWDAAREIFQVHLREDLPFHPNGSLANRTREEVIDVALSRLYGPNSSNELSTIKFRDGSQRSVSAAELMSGRLIQQICRGVCQRAFVRDVQSNEAGIQVLDVEDVVADVLQRLSSTLTAQNVRSYLADLPSDQDILSVQPIRRRVDRVHRLLRNDPWQTAITDREV